MNKRLEDIGFYTLSNERAKTTSFKSLLMRGELLLTDKCNLKCPYCRGLKREVQGEICLPFAQYILQIWVNNGLQNVRFSGGEPTLYPHLKALIKGSKKAGVKRIAISTNGTQKVDYYKELVDLGVNDFSISLDSGCCAIGELMTGGSKNAWFKASKAIQELSKYTYVTVGVVFNEFNYSQAKQTIKYIDGLCPADIRIISSAQYNKALTNLINISDKLLIKYPILKYRINNFRKKRNVRGIKKTDTFLCHLVKDDVAVAGRFHFPCIIYLREGGNPIGEMGEDFREERKKWFENHNSHKDAICKNNCLDVCIDYNNLVEKMHKPTEKPRWANGEGGN